MRAKRLWSSLPHAVTLGRVLVNRDWQAGPLVNVRFAPKADSRDRIGYVCFVPLADIALRHTRLGKLRP